jgi:hypothetical protein
VKQIKYDKRCQASWFLKKPIRRKRKGGIRLILSSWSCRSRYAPRCNWSWSDGPRCIRLSWDEKDILEALSGYGVVRESVEKKDVSSSCFCFGRKATYLLQWKTEAQTLHRNPFAAPAVGTPGWKRTAECQPGESFCGWPAWAKWATQIGGLL